MMFSSYQNRSAPAPGSAPQMGFQPISGPAGESALGRYLRSLMSQNNGAMSADGRAYANELAQRYYGATPVSYTGSPSASSGISSLASGAAKSGAMSSL
jgi:hypothetical protein